MPLDQAPQTTELPRLDEESVAVSPFNRGEQSPTTPIEPHGSHFAPTQEDTELSVAPRSESSNSAECQGSLVSRAQRKSKSLREYFGLPPDEEFVTSFNCALRQKILLQGHLYIFTHNICFYCNIFGFVQKRVIPLRDVVCIKKRKHYGLPNSIEIEYAGRSDLFASFLNRREAYRLMVDAWGNSSDGNLVLSASQRVVHKAVPGQEQLDDSPSGAGGRWVRHCVSARTMDANGSSSAAGSPQRRHMEAASFSSSRPRRSDDDDHTPADLMQGSSQRSSQMDSQRGSQMESQRDSQREPQGDPRQDSQTGSHLDSQRDSQRDPELDKLSVGATEVATTRASQARAVAAGVTEDTEASPADPPQRDEALSLIPGDPPPLAKGMVSAAEGSWDFSVRDSLTRVFSDQSPFWTEWHRGRGDDKVQLTPWQNITGSDAGRMRQLTFVTPFVGALKSLPMAPKEAPCQQTHRLQLFSGERLVYESTQHISGIPMGDLFKVETRVDITNTGTPQQPKSQIKTYVRVVFSKSTWLKGTIEKHTLSAVKESQADFIVKAGQATGVHLSPFQTQNHKGPKSLSRKGSGGIAIQPLARRPSGHMDRRRSSQLSRQLSGSMRTELGRQRSRSSMQGHPSIHEHEHKPSAPGGGPQDPRAAALRNSHDDASNQSPKSMRHTHSFNGPGGPHKSPLGPGSPMATAAADRAGALSEALSSSSSSLPMPALLLAALLAVIVLQVFILLRPARVQVQYAAPTAAHLAGVLQHVERMMAEVSALHRHLRDASVAP